MNYMEMIRASGRTNEDFIRAIKNVLVDYPGLGANGYDANRYLNCSDELNEFGSEEQAYWMCRDFLHTVKRIKNINKRYGSYGYKHEVEDWSRENGHYTYVPTGMFIAAAISLGFRVEFYGINAWSNIGKRNKNKSLGR